MGLVEVGCNRIVESYQPHDDELGSGAGLYDPLGCKSLALGDFGFDVVSDRIPAFDPCLRERHMHLPISLYLC